MPANKELRYSDVEREIIAQFTHPDAYEHWSNTDLKSRAYYVTKVFHALDDDPHAYLPSEARHAAECFERDLVCA